VDFELLDAGGGFTGFLSNYTTLHPKEIPNFHTLDGFFKQLIDFSAIIPPYITYPKEIPKFQSYLGLGTQLSYVVFLAYPYFLHRGSEKGFLWILSCLMLVEGLLEFYRIIPHPKEIPNFHTLD